ncbi:MAG: hypothetical protein R8J85_01690 [Mariprofundales bacterium]
MKMLAFGVGMLGMLSLWAASAQAVEVRADAVWWQYEEKSSDPRFVGAPFHSKADTITLAITTAEIIDINREWQWRYEISSLVPTLQGNERWSRSDFVQTNDLRIGQLEGQVALMRKLGGVNIGAWGALRWQQQARQHFKKNGARLPDSLVTETIRTAWLGGAISGERWRVMAGTPLWVRTTNSSITTVFSKRSGYRVGGEVHWPLATNIKLHGGYHYQQLGGDTQPSALWPKNRFQTISLGASASW